MVGVEHGAEALGVRVPNRMQAGEFVSGSCGGQPTDTLVRRQPSRSAQEFAPPYVPGMDAAGVLDEIGEG